MNAVLTAPEEDASSERAGWRAWVAAWWPELVILVGTLVLFSWGLSKNGLSNLYYTAAVRSMTLSWKNFVFGAFDPGGWITTDKPPLALWFGALSVRAFGLSSWSLLMPSVLAGVGSVGLLMGAVRRAWGSFAGRVAGVCLALTPVLVAVSRASNPDATLVLCLVATAYATQRAISDERPGWLVVAGLCCGLAFLSKLLVAGFVMPGAVGAYLLAGSGGWWRRIRDVVLSGVAFLVVAGGWIAFIDLTPASSRPYVALSSNNTALNLVFGANGFGRLGGTQAALGAPGSAPSPSGYGVTLPGLGGTPGIGRLFNASMGDQVMWLVIPAVLALVAGAVLAARGRPARPEVGSLVLWGGYALVSYFVLAYTQGLFHDYYVAALAPAIAALVGVGVALARRARLRSTPWVVVALLGTAALELVFFGRVDAYPGLRVLLPDLVPVALAVLAVLVVVAASRAGFLRRHLSGLLVAGLVVALLAPAAWTLSGVRHPVDAGFASAGPQLKAPGRGSTQLADQTLARAGSTGLEPAELEWLRRQHRHERWLVAVPSGMEAEGPIARGDSVMPLGGFYGTDPVMTRGRLASLVADHQLRFVDTSGFSLGANTSQINALVAQACAPVNPARWHGTAPGNLYDCAGRLHAIRTVKVSAAAAPGGGPGGIRLGPPAALQRLLTCFRAHHWNPTSAAPSLTNPIARAAIAACAALIPAAVPSAR